MAKRHKSKGGGDRNNERRNAKAWKKVKRTGREGATGRSCCGYSVANPARLGHSEGHRKA